MTTTPTPVSSDFQRIDERQLYRKVTRRIMPILIVGLFMSFIDRANLGVVGPAMSLDLSLSASAFGLAAGLFYVGYLLFEIPSNMLLVKFGARMWLARIMVSWGVVTALMAFAQNDVTIYILRMLLGIAEAGYFPGVLLYIAFWFPRSMLHRANATFQIGVPISLAIGSVFTASLLLLDGLGGVAGWRWVFIVQGVLAVATGIALYALLPNTPAQAKWLSSGERAHIVAAVAAPHAGATSELSNLARILRSVSAWLFAITYFLMLLGFWAITYFLPQIVGKQFDLDPVRAGMLAAVPWIAAGALIFVALKTSKKTGDRKWHLLVLMTVAGASLWISTVTASPVIALIGLSLAAAGMQATVPLFWTMPATIWAGGLAAVAIAMVNSFANIAGLIGPVVLGVFQDTTGSMNGGLQIFAICFILAGILGFAMMSWTDDVAKNDDASTSTPAVAPVVEVGA